MAHEDYITPVGFARESHTERRRIIGRIILFAFAAFLVWMVYNKVLNPDESTRAPTPTPSEILPGPI